MSIFNEPRHRNIIFHLNMYINFPETPKEIMNSEFGFDKMWRNKMISLILFYSIQVWVALAKRRSLLFCFWLNEIMKFNIRCRVNKNVKEKRRRLLAMAKNKLTKFEMQYGFLFSFQLRTMKTIIHRKYEWSEKWKGLFDCFRFTTIWFKEYFCECVAHGCCYYLWR